MRHGEDNHSSVSSPKCFSGDKQKLDRFPHLLLVMIPPWLKASFLVLNSDPGREG